MDARASQGRFPGKSIEPLVSQILGGCWRPSELIMGCSGMARYRQRLEDDTGLPVVDPTQAAVTMAIGAVRLGLVTAAQRG